MIVAAHDGKAARSRRFGRTAARPKPGVRTRDRVGRRVPKSWLCSFRCPEHANDGARRQRYHGRLISRPIAPRPTSHKANGLYVKKFDE
jgi:hypothetical protein